MTTTWTAEATLRGTGGADMLVFMEALALLHHPEGAWVDLWHSDDRVNVSYRPGADMETFRRRSARAFDLYVAFLEATPIDTPPMLAGCVR